MTKKIKKKALDVYYMFKFDPDFTEMLTASQIEDVATDIARGDNRIKGRKAKQKFVTRTLRDWVDNSEGYVKVKDIT